MRRMVPLCAILVLLASRPSVVQADELDGWCAQAKKASSIVTCSDAGLRQQAIIRNKLFDVARARLGPDDYKALNEDQSRWVKSYTARCGVSVDGPVPFLPLPQSVIDCYSRESRARTAYLGARLDLTVTLAAPTVSAPAEADLHQPPAHPLPGETPQHPALEKWFHCLWDAVAVNAKQPVPAERAVSAAFGECIDAEEGWRRRSAEEVGGDSPGVEVSLTQFKDETIGTALLKEITSIRAARAATAPRTAPPLPNENFLELPGGPVSWSYDLRTVDLIEPGKFTVTVILGLNPEIMTFELKALDTLRAFCKRPDGKYPGPPALFTLGEPDMQVKPIEVRTGPTWTDHDEKKVEWPVPYRHLANPDGRGGLVEEVS